MKNLKLLFYILAFVFSALVSHSGNIDNNNNSYDIVIYGGTSAGISAAIQSSRISESGSDNLMNEPTPFRSEFMTDYQDFIVDCF